MTSLVETRPEQKLPACSLDAPAVRPARTLLLVFSCSLTAFQPRSTIRLCTGEHFPIVRERHVKSLWCSSRRLGHPPTRQAGCRCSGGPAGHLGICNPPKHSSSQHPLSPPFRRIYSATLSINPPVYNGLMPWLLGHSPLPLAIRQKGLGRMHSQKTRLPL